MTNEEIRDKIARHFGLGSYGDGLVRRYLDEYAHNLAGDIREQRGDSSLESAHYFFSGMDFAADLIDPYLTD